MSLEAIYIKARAISLLFTKLIHPGNYINYFIYSSLTCEGEEMVKY